MTALRRHVITATISDRKGRVLSIGQNNYVKTHPLQAEHAIKVGEPHKIFIHAEVSAIIRCPDISRAHRILITRYDRQGRPALARPCAICASAIAATPIRIIEHT
jgi:tRNA(Arg) A34 adenosine deaminase TadA